MKSSRVSRSSTGFTLVELMISVAIIGVLASAAIPEYYRATLRSRATERGTVMDAVTRAVDETVMAHEGIPGGNWTGSWNPTAVPGTSKGHFVVGAVGWTLIPLVIQGDTYYSYMFAVTDTTGDGTQVRMKVSGLGDLDGDGAQSLRTDAYVGVGNSMQPDPDDTHWVHENPFVF